MSRGPAVDGPTLSTIASRHLGAPVEVDAVQRLSGGASREMWSFTVRRAGGPDGPDRSAASRYVLRRNPGVGLPTVDGGTECALLRAAAGTGVPVPPVAFELAPEDGLGTGFVMGHVDGETLGKRIVHHEDLAGAREDLARRLGVILARIHAIPPDSVPLPDPPGGATAGAQLTGFEQLLDGLGSARPVLEYALRWLRAHEPAGVEPAVVHGDFRIGNVIVGDDGVRAVLDWELAHRGDPVEDLGWVCVRAWRFGGPGRVGGVGDLDDLLAGYRAESGRDVDPEQVRYWEVFGNLRWAVICHIQASTHLSGRRRSVEHAAIGRRVAEVEHDLMELLA